MIGKATQSCEVLRASAHISLANAVKSPGPWDGVPTPATTGRHCRSHADGEVGMIL